MGWLLRKFIATTSHQHSMVVGQIYRNNIAIIFDGYGANLLQQTQYNIRQFRGKIIATNTLIIFDASGVNLSQQTRRNI